MCEVFAYIVSIMMLMSRDMCSVAHIPCVVLEISCVITHMLMSCNTFSAHIM